MVARNVGNEDSSVILKINGKIQGMMTHDKNNNALTTLTDKSGRVCCSVCVKPDGCTTVRMYDPATSVGRLMLSISSGEAAVLISDKSGEPVSVVTLTGSMGPAAETKPTE